MKKQLLFMMFMALVAMTFASCSSSDNEVQNEQGNQLSFSGGFNAMVAPQEINPWGYELLDDSLEGTLSKVSKFTLDDEAKTRAPQDNTWANMSDRNLSVAVGGNVYKYSVAANGAITSSTPYYFTTTSNVSVSAWYPYSASLGSFSVQANQSTPANYEKSFLLYGTMSTNQSNITNSISFAHKTAKLILTVKFTGAKYVLNSTINSLKINGAKITGTVSNGSITGTSGSATEITPYCSSASSLSNDVATAVYEVSLIPQTATLALTINDGGVIYRGSVPQTTYAANTIYTVTVNMDATPQAVNLGLPSGTKWANKNVGALYPADYGDYYTWGSSTPTTVGHYYECAKIRTSITPTSGYDTARNKWGGTWRMPTKTELDEILSTCTWTWTTQNGVAGYLIKSKTNSNSIFLPAAGSITIFGKNFCGPGSLESEQYRCVYFSSTYENWREEYDSPMVFALGDNKKSGVLYLDDDDSGNLLGSSALPCRPVKD